MKVMTTIYKKKIIIYTNKYEKSIFLLEKLLYLYVFKYITIF